MADLEYSVGVKTTEAQNGLKKLQSTVNNTTSVFGKLKGAIAGIAIGAIVKDTLNMANSMRDLSQATGIALQNITGFSQAMAANGSTIDRARDGLTDFVKNLGEASNGSSELQKSFARVGVDFNDLRNLSEQDILRKTIQGLANTSDSATRSSSAMRIFGESFKGVDIVGLNRDLDDFIAKSGQTARAIDSAGRANQNFKNTFVSFQTALLSALEPLSNLANKLLENTETVSRYIKFIIALGQAFLAFKALKIFTNGFIKLNEALVRGTSYSASLGKSIKSSLGGAGTSQAIKTIKREFSEFPNIFRGVAVETATLGGKFKNAANSIGVIGASFGRLIPVVGQVVAVLFAAGSAVEAITGKDLSGWAKTSAIALKKLFADTQEEITKLDAFAKSDIGVWDLLWAKITGKTFDLTTDGERMEDYFKRLYAQQKKNKELADENEKSLRQVVDAQKNALDKQLQTYRDKNEASLEALDIEMRLMGFRDEEVEYQRKIIDFTKQYRDELSNLENQLAELNKKPKENAQQIENIKNSIKETTAEYQAQLPFIEDAARLIAEEAKAARLAQEAADKLAESMEKVKEAAKSTTAFIKELKQSTTDASFEFESLNMNPLQKQIAQIDRDIKSKVNARVEELNALIADIDDPAQKDQLRKQIADISEAARKAIDTQQQLARKSYQYQRSFSYGWSQAFREYADNATNAAKKAGEIFNKTTQGIEDVLVNFVKTGKFEWKNFVADMLETLLRSQIQQTIAKVFDVSGLGGGTGGGGILDSILGMFGMGDSGATRGQNQATPLYVYDVAGGGGLGGGFGSGGGFGPGGAPAGEGGFFDSIGSTISNLISNPIQTISNGISSVVGGISNTIGSIFGGSSSSSSGGFFGGIADTVGSVVSGIGDFFGGFFANGGTLPAGKFGIAGEAGPELITGPASITPLSGLGGGSVTYNINAVDAASFKALVARDPGFIHAVAMKGASGIPGRR